MERWECEYCDARIECDTRDALHEARKAHVIDEHYEELGREFRESGIGTCQNCSGVLPAEPTGDPLECPHCGHVHDRWWAGLSDATTWDVG